MLAIDFPVCVAYMSKPLRQAADGSVSTIRLSAVNVACRDRFGCSISPQFCANCDRGAMEVWRGLYRVDQKLHNPIRH
jgi:hypothetical protein